MAASPQIKNPRLRLPEGPRPRLRLSPLRTEGSVDLDGVNARGVDMPPFMRWKQFYAQFQWKQGQHITLIGPTEAGKTTLALSLLPMRKYVLVFGTKTQDESLYPRLQREGFVIQDELDLDAQEFPRIIFRPPLDNPSRDGRVQQGVAFAEALTEVFRVGGWCLYLDEVRYLTEELGLKNELNTLWLQGRSLGVSIVASTQRPVSIPLLAFEEPAHLFAWQTPFKDNIDRIAEFSGVAAERVRYVLPRLPEHEALYINTRSGTLIRTNIRL